MRSRRPPSGLAGAALALALPALLLSACSGGAPPGVDKIDLDEAVSRAIGDPNSCLMIAQAGTGKRYYQYNTHTACDAKLPTCVDADNTHVSKVLDRVAKDRQPVMLSCNTLADASRGVSWAAGQIEGTDLVYAAMMEGDRAFPGRMMADRLDGAFRRVGLSKPAK